MRAISVGLIRFAYLPESIHLESLFVKMVCCSFNLAFFFNDGRGAMDEVDQNLHVSWVQPRILDNQQVSYFAHHYVIHSLLIVSRPKI